MEIRELGEEDARAWWTLRLEALESDPFAFGRSAEEHRATPVAAVAARFRGEPGFTLGAFNADRLVGMATFRRDTGVKQCHKGHIYGVYVTRAMRGKGVGESLLRELVRRARADESLEQILLEVTAGKGEAAGRLYRKIGFQSFGMEPRSLKVGAEYADSEYMVLMVR